MDDQDQLSLARSLWPRLVLPIKSCFKIAFEDYALHSMSTGFPLPHRDAANYVIWKHVFPVPAKPKSLIRISKTAQSEAL
jgi:hypothetical protein